MQAFDKLLRQYRYLVLEILAILRSSVREECDEMVMSHNVGVYLPQYMLRGNITIHCKSK